MTQGANDDQAAFWNGEVGRRWVAHEKTLDDLTSEVSARLLTLAELRPGMRVLDVGCGGGGLSLDLARAVGPEGEVLGLDLSGQLLERAERRRDAEGLAQLTFRQEDAQTAALPQGAYDLVVSDFGAMFFNDPVAAFNNLRRALRPGGRIVLAAWGPVSENPFFHIPRGIAVRRMGAPPGGPPAPDAPGPFAFADASRAVSILTAAGFSDARAEALQTTLWVPGGIEALGGLVTEIGPAAGILREMSGTAEDRTAIRDAVRDAFAPFATPDGIRIPARINLFAARQP